MNKVVLDHYPTAKLPAELRETFAETGEVRLTIEASTMAATTDPTPRPGLFSKYRRHARTRFSSIEEIDDHVRALREEWDHRDR